MGYMFFLYRCVFDWSLRSECAFDIRDSGISKEHTNLKESCNGSDERMTIFASDLRWNNAEVGGLCAGTLTLKQTSYPHEMGHSRLAP